MRSSRVVRASDDNQCQVATVQGSIPASHDTVESEGRQIKQCWIKYRKITQIPILLLFYVSTSVAGPDLLNPNPDPAFQVNPGPDPGSWWPKIEDKKRAEKIIFFLIKICNLILLSSCKNSKKNLDSFYFVTLFDFLSLKNDVNVIRGKNFVIN